MDIGIYENDTIYKIKRDCIFMGTEINTRKIVGDFKRKFNVPQSIFCAICADTPAIVMIFGWEKVIFIDNKYYLVEFEIRCGNTEEYIISKEPITQEKIDEVSECWKKGFTYKTTYEKSDDFYYELSKNKKIKCTEEYWKSVPEELRAWIIQ